MRFTTPVVFIIYNRPEHSRKVFETIRKLKPSQLFIIGDGPKNDVDRVACKKAQSVVEKLDWDVDVQKNISEINLGCRKRITSGLDWVFQKTDRAIILEDDCLPHTDFFRFCDELLEYYQNDETIMHISGCNFNEKLTDKYSYVFSNWMMCWGWATWSRAWQKHTTTFDVWKNHHQQLIQTISPEHRNFWNEVITTTESTVDDWSIPWIVDIWLNKGLTIFPTRNLVTNIGYDTLAMNTRNASSPFSKLTTEPMKFPLVHPSNKQVLFDRIIELTLTEVAKDAKKHDNIQQIFRGKTSYHNN